MGFLSFLTRPTAQPADPQKNPADAGRALRQMMLTTSPAKTGQKPTKEFPRICGVLMDWPLGDQIATVFSTSTGAASLYTTSTFGIIGGEGHETVRAAARKFVRAADRCFDSSTPTTEYPYLVATTSGSICSLSKASGSLTLTWVPSPTGVVGM